VHCSGQATSDHATCGPANRASYATASASAYSPGAAGRSAIRGSCILRRIRITRFLIDGEEVCCDDHGISDFARLHSRAHDGAAFLYAFDLLAVDGDDIRRERLDERRVKLSRLLARPDGIRVSEHLAGDGARVFEHACGLGLEGIVSKRRDAPYRSGRSRAWLKVKNPASPAMRRLE
jgi:ATP-dependent DNA ligase